MTQVAPIAVAAGLLGLAAAFAIFFSLRRRPAGSTAMRELAELIERGAMAFLRREYLALFPFLVIVAALLAWTVGSLTATAYVFGGLCSVGAGLFGMKAATKANVRTAEAARAACEELSHGRNHPDCG